MKKVWMAAAMGLSMAGGMNACAKATATDKTQTTESETIENETNMEKGNQSKVLVVYFSHAGENYSVGNIKEGNTAIVVDYIVAKTGAERFEIKTSKYDGMAYKPLCDLALEEQKNNELPPFEGEPGDLKGYDTVFVGGPVWWGTYPQVMFTFFEKYDLNGKTVIPFTTHEGSGLGRTVSDLRKLYPEATVKEGFAMYGHEVRGGKDKVEKWLEKLGY